MGSGGEERKGGGGGGGGGGWGLPLADKLPVRQPPLSDVDGTALCVGALIVRAM